MRNKRLIATFLLALICGVGVQAQEEDLRKDFENYRKGAHKDFDDFRKQALMEYSDFVRQAWKSFNASGRGGRSNVGSWCRSGNGFMVWRPDEKAEGEVQEKGQEGA